jgi:predicted aspartyl protease
MIKKLSFAAVSALLVGCASPALAEDQCKLVKIASLDIGTDEYGGTYVPMTIAGHKLNLLVDTGGIYSMLTEKTVKDLALQEEYASRLHMHMYGGAVIDRYVKTDEIILGQLKASHWKFAVMPDALPAELNGTVAPDVLQQFDVDFDFAAGKLNLFSKEHCAGKVVYWTRAPVAAIPIRLDMWGHLTVPVKLDGEEIQATIDTGSSRSLLSLQTAEHKFDFGEDDAQLKPAAPDSGEKAHVYTYPFKVLTLEGVTVKNPDIVLVSDQDSKIGRSGPRLILGMGILRQLHLYISYGEEKLYVTAASVKSNTPPADTSNLFPPPNPVSLQCTNPAVEGQFQPDGPAGALTAKMTFAINSDPASGAVHVAPGSDAVCTVHANKGAVIASSTFALDPAVLGTDSGRELLKHVQIDERIAGDNTKPEAKAFVFTVKTTSSTRGNLVLDFPVRYR